MQPTFEFHIELSYFSLGLPLQHCCEVFGDNVRIVLDREGEDMSLRLRFELGKGFELHQVLAILALVTINTQYIRFQLEIHWDLLPFD